jgi:Uma2 family endonuclease
MATGRLTFEEFQSLPEHEGTTYELDEGELLMEASPAARHNLVRQRVAMRLMQFVDLRRLGLVLEETDFRLAPETVRNPDVAFVTSEQVKHLDLDRSPLDGAPAIAVEVISPTNRAEDIVKKIGQYLEAGCHSVWVVYPSLRLAEIHTGTGVQRVREPDALKHEDLLPDFSLPLSYVLEGDPR